MQKVLILATGEIKEVSNNEAHDLIDKRIGILYRDKAITKPVKDKMMRPRTKKRKGYQTK